MPEASETLEDAVLLENVGLAELNCDGCFTTASSEFLSMLGLREADLLGQNWRATIHPEDHHRAQEAYRLAALAGGGYVEIRGLRHDPTILHQALTVIGLHDDRGAFRGYRCLVRDISGFKREREVLTLAVESAPNGLLMLDSAGRIRFANRAMEDLFGYSREELAGKAVEMLLPGRLSGDASVTSARGWDQLGLRKGGAEIPVQVYLNRIESRTGEMIFCTIADIAERVAYERQLQLAKQTAEAANHAKSDFLTRMSHEIRTPMNLIMGMNALLWESPLNDKQRQQIEISYRNVRRLLRLINGILDLSRMEAGNLTLEAVPFDLHEIVEECAATASAAVERKGLNFEWSIDSAVSRYWIGDPERLQQVLLNLIGNSVKFTERGKIEVRVHAGSGGQDTDDLRFEVIDTGCGIPSGKAGMVFEAFQQVEGSMSRPYEETGLGLAIAKTLVELMSGRIWVEEKSGPGAAFVFTTGFPRSTEQDVRERMVSVSTAKEVKAVAPGTRVLLVEDNPENMILLRAYLENLSLSLDFASNGVEALDRRKAADYDLVLMDIQMPVMDGYTATREIRAWEKIQGQPRIPIVALTAHALTRAFEESQEAGCDGHLAKPVERRDLVAAIARFAQPPAVPPEAIPEAIQALRPKFLANRRLDLEKLRDALAAQDFPAIQAIGHNCKGTGAGYGFPEIGRLGADVERAAKSRNATEVEQSIRNLEQCIAALANLQ